MSDSPPSSPPRRKRSPRFVEIAAAAGVSPTTVNRVLNERGSVSPEMRAKVIAAAKQLGVPRVLPDPRHGLTRFDVVLADSPTPYFDRLVQALQRASQTLDPRILIHLHRVDPDRTDEVTRQLTQPRHRRDGLIVALSDSPTVRAGLRHQTDRGVPIATLMSGIGDVPDLRYVGIDNRAAGRTAGHFIGRLSRSATGRVLLVTHRLSYRAHAQRTLGCKEVIAERHPGLSCTEPVECFDDPDRAHFAVRHALDNARQDGVPLVGMYTSGAGTAGVASALQKLTPHERPVWIGHEIHDTHRRLLQLGLLEMVIDQDPVGQVQAALHHLLHATGYVEQPGSDRPNEFRLFCAENLGQTLALPHGV